MEPIVFLIGHTEKYLKSVEVILEPLYKLKRVNKSALMIEIYKTMPCAIVIIQDDLDGDGLLLIDSTISLEFIPTICINYNGSSANSYKIIKHASYISYKDSNILLPPLIQQAYYFGDRFHGLHMCQDTYDVMNEETSKTLEALLAAEVDDGHSIIKNYFDQVFIENFFLDNDPEMLWIVRKTELNRYYGEAYSIRGEIQESIQFFEDDSFEFDRFMETGFFKNSKDPSLSDIEDAKQLIPEHLIPFTNNIENAACFAMSECMLIGVNYSQSIRQSDLNILKALTLKVDLMLSIKDKVREIEESFNYTMDALARAAEGRDDTTGHHIKRVNHYAEIIAVSLELPIEFIQEIKVAAQMHDVGKIFTPESVLSKPGKLTEEEFEIIKQHTIQGEIIIGESKNLKMASRIARSHHEKYDGSGYPDGLIGESIPIEARIIALADVYDALRGERPYKKGFSHEVAVNIITEGDGRVMPYHFDPKILKIFKDQNSKFEAVFKKMS